ncbi:MAG: PDZ domain-containing protein [Deltaproteobacteria bacterium]|nr:PDZ domain-containing protein [Deltaproteobacteria bacterium]
MKNPLISVICCFLLCTGFLFFNSCASYTRKSIAPHINLSPENMQLTQDSEKGPDFGMEVEGNESDTLDNLEVLPGVRIRSIEPSGAAEMGGLKRGDIILSINDIKTNHPDTVATICETSKADQFVFDVRRDTTVFETTIEAPKSTKRAEPKERYRAEPLKTRAGYRTELVQMGMDNDKKVAVARIVQLWPESPLIKAGIEVGDAVVSVDNVPVESAQGLINRLAENYQYGQEVTLSILDKDAGNRSEPSTKKVILWNPGRRLSRFNIWPLFMYEARLNPDKERFSILNFWNISLFSYERDEGERSYNFLKFIRFQSSNRGELVDKTNSTEN